MTVNVQEAAADRHLVLYDNFYLVQYLLDKKSKLIYILQITDHLFINKMVIASKLLLNTLRVLGIILRCTLFRPVCMEAGQFFAM